MFNTSLAKVLLLVLFFSCLAQASVESTPTPIDYIFNTNKSYLCAPPLYCFFKTSQLWIPEGIPSAIDNVTIRAEQAVQFMVAFDTQVYLNALTLAGEAKVVVEGALDLAKNKTGQLIAFDKSVMQVLNFGSLSAYNVTFYDVSSFLVQHAAKFITQILNANHQSSMKVEGGNVEVGQLNGQIPFLDLTGKSQIFSGDYFEVNTLFVSGAVNISEDVFVGNNATLSGGHYFISSLRSMLDTKSIILINECPNIGYIHVANESEVFIGVNSCALGQLALQDASKVIIRVNETFSFLNLSFLPYDPSKIFDHPIPQPNINAGVYYANTLISLVQGQLATEPIPIFLNYSASYMRQNIEFVGNFIVRSVNFGLNEIHAQNSSVMLEVEQYLLLGKNFLQNPHVNINLPLGGWLAAEENVFDLDDTSFNWLEGGIIESRRNGVLVAAGLTLTDGKWIVLNDSTLAVEFLTIAEDGFVKGLGNSMLNSSVNVFGRLGADTKDDWTPSIFAINGDLTLQSGGIISLPQNLSSMETLMASSFLQIKGAFQNFEGQLNVTLHGMLPNTFQFAEFPILNATKIQGQFKSLIANVEGIETQIKIYVSQILKGNTVYLQLSATAPESESSSGNDGVNVGAIVGGVLAGVAAVAIVAVVALRFRNKKRMSESIDKYTLLQS